MSLHHFIEYLKEHKKVDLILFHFAALLASLSNFTLVTVYVSLLLVYNLQLFLNTRFVLGERFLFFQKNKAHLIPLLLVAVVLYEPVRRVLTYSDINFGGKNGYFADTVTHLISNNFHNIAMPLSIMVFIQIIFTLIILIPLFIIVKNTLQKRSEYFDQHRELITSSLLLIFISIIIIFQHLILKSDYPIGRFSKFLFSLFMVHLGLFINYFMVSGYKKVCLIILSCVSLTSTVSFWNNTNLISSAEWDYDSQTKSMIQTLASRQEMIHAQSKKK